MGPTISLQKPHKRFAARKHMGSDGSSAYYEWFKLISERNSKGWVFHINADGNIQSMQLDRIVRSCCLLSSVAYSSSPLV